MEKEKKPAIIYTSIIIFLGFALLIHFTLKSNFENISKLLFLTFLSITAESMAVPLGKDKGLSVGFAITLCALLTLGPVGAAWVTAAGAMLKVLYVKGHGYIHILNTPLYKTAFNASNYIISCISAGFIYNIAGGQILSEKSSNFKDTLEFIASMSLPLILLILTFLIVNSGILSILICLMSQHKSLLQWLHSLKWAIPNLFAVAAIGIIITVSYHSLGTFAVLLFLCPLLLARYSFKLYIDMRNVYFETIKALIAAIEAKDKYTVGHSKRVEKYVSLIASEMKIPQSKMEIMKYAALLHDIGKIGISESILNKASALSDAEFDKIKEHPYIGCKILEEVDFLKQANEIILYHHERYDGLGYPTRLKGEKIPLESQIMAVADAFDAMTSDRPYRKALSTEQAIVELKRNSGTQFSPEIVEVFVKALIKHESVLDNVSGIYQ